MTVDEEREWLELEQKLVQARIGRLLAEKERDLFREWSDSHGAEVERLLESNKTLTRERDDLKAKLSASDDRYVHSLEMHGYLTGQVETLTRERDQLKAKLADLTVGEPLAGGGYRPSRIEELESDREERDYWQRQAAEAREERAGFAEQVETLTKARDTWKAVALERQNIKADFAKAEARVKALREALDRFIEFTDFGPGEDPEIDKLLAALAEDDKHE